MKKIIKNILILLSYFLYDAIFIVIAEMFGFNYFKTSRGNQLLFSLITSLIFILFLFCVYRHEIKNEFKDFKENGKKHLKKYVIYYIIGVIAMGLSNLIIQSITKTNLSANEENVRNLIQDYPIYMSIISVITAPIIEEFIFRKSFKNIFKLKYLFIIISGFIFGILHVADFSNISQILLGIPYILMGIDFAYIYYKTDNLFVTLTFHSAHNLVLLIIQLI